MILGIITLLIAVVISIVSAYYSILGLTAIFAAAFWPIVIMGGALEAGKVITAVWLHANWKRAEMQYKLYLVPAICFLMILTSMGVFGFLSKSHSDQNLVSGDVVAKIAIYDEKIKIAKDNIDANRRALTQLDAAVDQTMSRSNDERGAERAVQIRRSQASERSRLLKEIDQEQKKIQALNEEAAPIRAEVRKVEADVGPIKYIAALIYGDNPDTNILEKAVRWVIILIVIVFDPLAVVLILAGIKQLEWSRKTEPEESESVKYYPMSGSGDVPTATIDEMIESEEVREDQHTHIPVDTYYVSVPPTSTVDQQTLAEDPLITETPTVVEPTVEEINQEFAEAVEPKDIEQEFVPEVNEELIELQTQLAGKDSELTELRDALVNLHNDQVRLGEINAQSLQREQDLYARIRELEAQLNPEPVVPETFNPEKFVAPPVPETAPRFKAPIEEVPPTVAEVVETVVEEPQPEFVSPNATGLDASNERPGDYLKPEEVTVPVRDPLSGFGSVFPNDPERGDMFMRTDFKPSRLFKWNDIKWLEINKNSTAVYGYNDAYIQHLAEKLSKGEYSIDDLSETELNQVQSVLGGRRV